MVLTQPKMHSEFTPVGHCPACNELVAMGNSSIEFLDEPFVFVAPGIRRSLVTGRIEMVDESCE